MLPSTMTACRAIDHVMLRLPQVDPWFSLFSEVFQLPVSWPVRQSDFATFAWVHVGNTHLEFWAATDNTDLSPGCPLPMFHGLALEPDGLSTGIARLAQAGIACKPPRPYQTRNAQGEWVTNFTNSVLLSVSSADCCIFFCEWGTHGSIIPWRQGLTTGERRAQDRVEFERCGGGPLGLIKLAGIRLVSRAADTTRVHWRVIAGAAAGEVPKIDGVTLDVVAGDADRIDLLIFEVRSLEVARDFLRRQGLLDTSHCAMPMLSLAVTQGLNFGFVESGC